MSNQKIRHWIYVAITVALLGYLAWLFLLRDAGITQNTISETLREQQQYYQDVADYLIKKQYSTEITDLITVDHSFGIKSEDTNEYRAFINGLEKLMEKEGGMRIRANGKSVLFIHPAQGGLFAQQYFVIAKNADESALPGEFPVPLTGEWQYYIIEGKP